MALAAVAFAAGLQAATVTWTLTNVIGPTGSANGGTAYMFGYVNGSSDALTAATIASAIQDAFADTGVAGVQGILDGHYSWTPASTAGTYSDTTKNMDPVGDLGFTAGQYYNVYAVIFDSTTLTSDSKFFVTQELANKAIPTGNSNLLLGFASQATRSTAEGAWTAVPEPTSGLLMLLGMAGLALKRKRA